MLNANMKPVFEKLMIQKAISIRYLRMISVTGILKRKSVFFMRIMTEMDPLKLMLLPVILQLIVIVMKMLSAMKMLVFIL